MQIEPRLQLLFPADPLNSLRVDPDYADEQAAARALGYHCSVFGFDEFQQGRWRARPPLTADRPVLYRGWMLSAIDYAHLHQHILQCGAQMYTSPEDYALCHYLPNWYQTCAEFTPATVFVDAHGDYAAALAGKDWAAYFVKDHVKSLTTQRGSKANSIAQIDQVVRLLEQYRGQIEGGICIREFEELLPASEQRYFVLAGRPYARHGAVPELVLQISAVIRSPFYSVDVVENSRGQMRLIELGDGQVSDRKQWSVEQFMAMLAKSNA